MFKPLSVLSALLTTFLIIGTAHATPPGDTPEAFLNGATVAVGSMVATGTADNGGCTMPQTEVTGNLPDGYAVGVVTLSIDAECRMTYGGFTYTKATPIASPGGVLAASNGERYKGWAKSELNDFVGIDLASVYVETFYYADEREVWNGHNQSIDCDQFDHTQWRVLSCVLSYDPTGPGEIWVKGVGHFQSELIRLSRHWQAARFTAWPNKGRFRCQHSGWVIGPVNWKCTGTRYDH